MAPKSLNQENSVTRKDIEAGTGQCDQLVVFLPKSDNDLLEGRLGLGATEQGIPRRLLFPKPPVYVAHVFGERDSELGRTHQPPATQNKSVNDFTATTTSCPRNSTSSSSPTRTFTSAFSLEVSLFARRS
ncbi:hypothetical protein GWK47_045632 [Chionoecetes opilio]|uniref:Uncharacterized protein n=1 Tax=Chionoecetes opilio TaxID=41210 RepID=A0A8J5CV45_CHIOP|nr:hypothetical protein GWK47_045632 [Chionoecetes opilio]